MEALGICRPPLTNSPRNVFIGLSYPTNEENLRVPTFPAWCQSHLQVRIYKPLTGLYYHGKVSKQSLIFAIPSSQNLKLLVFFQCLLLFYFYFFKNANPRERSCKCKHMQQNWKSKLGKFTEWRAFTTLFPFSLICPYPNPLPCFLICEPVPWSHSRSSMIVFLMPSCPVKNWNSHLTTDKLSATFPMSHRVEQLMCWIRNRKIYIQIPSYLQSLWVT